ncbi:MAG: lipoyl(octanoyl) transferase LipB [Alistipes sp.]|nr:lipoyl(octanoyl) transferase LipB [Alistipes sp.]
MDYKQCWDLQRSLFDALIEKKSELRSGVATESDESIGTILLVEHPAVYTLGKNGKESNLLLGEEYLRSIGADFYRIDRGGDVTFHGEGQIVGYPIIDIERVGIGLRDYINALEQSVIDTIAHYGIEAGRLAGASGVWLGSAEERNLRKICAIGVRASRFITMHGFALNVTTDLRYFNHINPCGFTDKGVTSMERELGSAPDMEEVKTLVINNLSKNLNVKIYKN